MVETIDKIRLKISKLLNRIADLERNVVQKDEEFYQFKFDLALKIIEKRDSLEQKYEETINTFDSEIEKKLVTHQFEKNKIHINEILKELNVSQLASPLDTLADFTEVVGTIKDPKKMNGRVVKVLKAGYLIGEELIRSSQVIVVKND